MDRRPHVALGPLLFLFIGYFAPWLILGGLVAAPAVLLENECGYGVAARLPGWGVVLGAYGSRGKALSVASVVEIDAVIDPAETRAWLVRGLKACPVPPRAPGKKRPFIDTW